MSTSAPTGSRSVAQWIVTIVFGALSAAFLFRTVQLGSKWMRHVVEGDLNFKALTLWALAYFIICGVIAAVAFFMPRETDEVETRDAERGT